MLNISVSFLTEKMVPAILSKVQKLAELWSQSIQQDGGHALLPIHDDLQRTVSNICSNQDVHGVY